MITNPGNVKCVSLRANKRKKIASFLEMTKTTKLPKQTTLRADRFVPRDDPGCIRSKKNHFYNHINNNLLVGEYE